MVLLHKEHFTRVNQLFAPLDHHLAIGAVLSGATPGTIWVDDLEFPHAGLLRVHHRCYFSGDPNIMDFNRTVKELFTQEILPDGRQNGDDAISLYFTEGWEAALVDLLSDLAPIYGERRYLERENLDSAKLPDLEEGLYLVEVNQALLEDKILTNVDELRQEMVSERSSTEEFLESSFGVCLRNQDRIITWCLSEYNVENRCEVGITTDPLFRRRGLAVYTGKAFEELAAVRGISRIGWHCWVSNHASWSTALKIGYNMVKDYPSYIIFMDRSVHLAVQGDIYFNQNLFADALTCFLQAIAIGNPPGWVYLTAACAAARVNEIGIAFQNLKAAYQHGTIDPQRVIANEHLKNLHSLEEWRFFIQSIQ